MTKMETWYLFNKHIKLIAALHERWIDEGDYEDISEYLSVVKAHIPNAEQIEEDTFTLHFKATNGDLKIIPSEEKGNLVFSANGLL